MQWLLSQAIPRQHQLATAFVVQGESKHASKLVHAVGAELFIQMDDHLRIGVGVETMAAALQLRAQFREIVNLAVENNPDRPVLVENWLVPSGQIDDAETAHAEARPLVDEDSFIIRAAVDDGLAHVVNRGCFYAVIYVRANDAGNSAHALSLRMP